MRVPSTSTDHARWQWRRAAAFGTVSASIGVFGHAWSMGVPPSWLVLVAATILLTLYGRIFTWKRFGTGSMLCAVTIAQLFVHGACMLDAELRMGSSGSMDGMAMAHDAKPLVAMLAVHAIAIVVGTFVLLRLERAAWRGIARVVEMIVETARAFVMALIRALTRTVAPAVAVCSPRVGAASRRWFVACAARRGPPLLLA